jgi:hypothetical protein
VTTAGYSRYWRGNEQLTRGQPGGPFAACNVSAPRTAASTVASRSEPQQSTAAAEPAFADRVACFLTLTKELLIRHDRLIRVRGLPVGHVRIVIGDANHQPSGLHDHVAHQTCPSSYCLGRCQDLSHHRPPMRSAVRSRLWCYAGCARLCVRRGCRRPPWSKRLPRTDRPNRHRGSR